MMKHLFVNPALAILLIGLACTPSSFAQSAMPQEHEHKMVQIPDGALIPKLDLALSKDEMSGYNLVIKTENFQLEPPGNADEGESKTLEGHGHIYINGKKVYRAYGEHIHLPGKLLKLGTNQIMVSLNDHQHNTWSKGSRMVMTTLVIDTRKEHFLQHRFATFGMGSTTP